MPLIQSSSDKALRKNMATLSADIGKSPHVQNQKQAVAIALETQRRNRADGGVVSDPIGKLIEGLAPSLQDYSRWQDIPLSDRVEDRRPLNGELPGVAPKGDRLPLVNETNFGPYDKDIESAVERIKNEHSGRRRRANKAAGGGMGITPPRAPNLRPPIHQRQEDRQLHVGPILSAVPGRTDNHRGKVPAGSYVIPADIVSGRGQGNTIAGAAALQRMFKMGPYGVSLPRGGGRSSIPRAPSLGVARADGGASDGQQELVPVDLAGGEIVVPPENLREVIHPDLDTAHSIMDSWVLNERDNLRKTLAKLPGPAKD